MGRAYLFDLDGTLYQGDSAIPGAVALIDRLRAERTPFRFVTNTTSRPRSAIVDRLRGYGFALDENELFTALLAGADVAKGLGCRTLLPLVTPPARKDLEGFDLVDQAWDRAGIDAVVVGDLGERWSFEHLQQAFTALMHGARLIALSHDRYWMSGNGLTIDCGALVKALEYASGQPSILAGKPSVQFYQAAVHSMALSADTEVIMVGDDLRSDVKGAQDAGYLGYLVRTGKFNEDTLASSAVVPDRILDSVAEL